MNEWKKHVTSIYIVKFLIQFFCSILEHIALLCEMYIVFNVVHTYNIAR